MPTASVVNPVDPAPGRRGRIAVMLPVLSLLLLAAHFLRFGNPGLCLAAASLAALAVTRRAWVESPLRAALAAGRDRRGVGAEGRRRRTRRRGPSRTRRAPAAWLRAGAPAAEGELLLDRRAAEDVGVLLELGRDARRPAVRGAVATRAVSSSSKRPLKSPSAIPTAWCLRGCGRTRRRRSPLPVDVREAVLHDRIVPSATNPMPVPISRNTATHAPTEVASSRQGIPQLAATPRPGAARPRADPVHGRPSTSEPIDQPRLCAHGLADLHGGLPRAACTKSGA